MADLPKIIPNYFPKRPQPVTEEDFHVEMATEALKDLLIHGYHMAANGIELTMADVDIDPLISGSIMDAFDDG